MPLWGDPKGENFKAKLEHKMCIAKETPAASFDLADCNLSGIPPGVFSMCRVFRKESLILENNNISNISTGGTLKDLSQILVLNLKNNKISSLPLEIAYLTNLQVLDLENNQLKKLPSTFEKLENLQVLNLKNNKLQSFPVEICSLYKLQSLNLCDNSKIRSLPKELCNLVLICDLQIDASHYIYPTQDICQSGTENIMKYLCFETGKDYCPPSDVDPEKVPSARRDEQISPIRRPSDAADFSASYLQYQRTKERRMQDLLLMEESFKENLAIQSSVTADSNLRKRKLLDDIALDQDRMETEILQLQNKKDKERKVLLNFLTNVESHSANLIDQLIGINNKRKRVEEMSALLEKDRQENEEIFSIKQEELQSLRKKEILEAMTEMLQQEETRGKYEAEKVNMIERMQNDENESNVRLENIFQGRDIDQQILVNRLLAEEKFQKEAFEVLQLQRDAQHQEIAHQIRLVEKELASLTTAEIKKKDLRMSVDVNVLAEHRIALASLLTELMDARERRESELKDRLQQMEEKRVQEMEDFWLIQYQKLLDRKPKGIMIAESGMDEIVKEILLEISAPELIPLFAAKEVTFPQLLTLSINDLKSIGVVDDAVCEAILAKAQEFYKRQTYQEEDQDERQEPSAPPESEEPFEMIEPTAPILSPESETRLWCQTECVICMDTQTSAVFLPCGHVCCCQNCSSNLESCPLCRTTIASKFILAVT